MSPSFPSRGPFWLGLLLGGLAAYRTRRRWLPGPAAPDPLLDRVADGLVVCDAQGRVIQANAAAHRLFGPDQSDLDLCYPSGQTVPPGQTPLAVGLAGGASQGQYLLGGRLLDVQAWPHRGGAAVLFRDVTAQAETAAREVAAERTARTLRDAARLLAVVDGSALPDTIAAGALALLDGLPEAQASVFWYDREAKTLTRLASAPDDRPKRPKSQRQARPPTQPFDANDPQTWAVYVARESYRPSGGRSLALPLLSKGVTIGHLLLTCGHAGAFEEGGRRDALTTLASAAASALVSQRQAERVGELSVQMETLRDVGLAQASGQSRDALADLLFLRVPSALGVELCTFTWREKKSLRLAGAAFREALLFPDRPVPADEAAQEATATGQTVQRLGLANPDFGAGPWRAFAGQSGRHSILSVPIPSGRGALTVYAAGDGQFSDNQMRFTETLAALLGASPPAGRTGP